MKKNKKEILFLSEFTDEKTFYLLDERASHIEKLILEVEKLRNLPIEIWNIFETYSLSISDFMISHTELICILYRSMFQAASFESGARIPISTDAYNYQAEDEKLHDRIITYADEILAHQDNYNSVKNDSRNIYPETINLNGIDYYIPYRKIEFHADFILALVLKMKKSILDIYYSKFDKKMPCSFISKQKKLERCDEKI